MRVYCRGCQVNRKPLEQRRLVLDDLIEGTDCEYRVAAQNEAGVGKPSETGMFKVSLQHTDNLRTDHSVSGSCEINGVNISILPILHIAECNCEKM